MLPIEYWGEVVAEDGSRARINLESPGWLSNELVRQARSFWLVPKESAKLPLVGVDLSPLPNGTARRLVYFSRVVGVIGDSGGALYRLYCLGWQATIGQQNVKLLQWICPNGAVLAADEPPE